MSTIVKVISLIFMLIGAILSVLLFIQVFEMISKKSDYLFFELIFAVVWGAGALIFWIIGIVIHKSNKKSKE